MFCFRLQRYNFFFKPPKKNNNFMKITFCEKATNLHNDCIKALGQGKNFWQHTRAFDEWGGNIGYDIYNKEYEAIIWINGKWQLVKDGHLFDLNNITLEELCEYTDQIISNIKKLES